jgi:dolichol-phosphate mannosyltransferase
MPAETLIIVPTYNERENLPDLVRRLGALTVPVDVLVVDDSSPDGTGQIADELAARHPWVHVLHRTVKDGLGRAYVAGFQWALARDYAFVFEMDADFSHNPADIPRFLQAAQEQKADLVLGSRYSGGIRVINWPLSRLLLSLWGGFYTRIIAFGARGSRSLRCPSSSQTVNKESPRCRGTSPSRPPGWFGASCWKTACAGIPI